MDIKLLPSIFLLVSIFSFQLGLASSLKAGDVAPIFQTQTHESVPFDLNSRKGKWTVLYFYPKAETPGCTTQACAFRDAIKSIQALGAEVFGVSSDNVKTIKAFHDHHHLTFTLLADPDAKIIKAYGTKMPIIGISRRHTFVIDPELVIRDINTSVDPAKDPQLVASKIKELQTKKQ